MKTIQELNEKWYWRLVKFFYFLISWVIILFSFFIIYDLYNFYPKNTLNEIKKQITWWEDNYKKLNKWKIESLYMFTYNNYLKNFEYSYFTPIKNINRTTDLEDAYSEMYSFALMELWISEKEKLIWKK